MTKNKTRMIIKMKSKKIMRRKKTLNLKERITKMKIKNKMMKRMV